MDDLLANLLAFALQKPIIPADLYRAVRDSQLVGMSGYTKEVLLSSFQHFFRLKIP